MEAAVKGLAEADRVERSPSGPKPDVQAATPRPHELQGLTEQLSL